MPLTLWLTPVSAWGVAVFNAGVEDAVAVCQRRGGV
jgi:hypothetical protein